MSFSDQKEWNDYDEKTTCGGARDIRPRCDRRRRREPDQLRFARASNYSNPMASYRRIQHPGPIRGEHAPTRRYSLRRLKKHRRTVPSGFRRSVTNQHAYTRSQFSPYPHNSNRRTSSGRVMRRQTYRMPIPQSQQRCRRRSRTFTPGAMHNVDQARRPRNRKIRHARMTSRSNRRLRNPSETRLPHSRNSQLEVDRTLSNGSATRELIENKGVDEKDCPASLALDYAARNPTFSRMNMDMLIDMSMEASPDRTAEQDSLAQIRSDELLARSLHLTYMENYHDMDENSRFTRHNMDNNSPFTRHFHNPSTINSLSHYPTDTDDDILNEASEDFDEGDWVHPFDEYMDDPSFVAYGETPPLDWPYFNEREMDHWFGGSFFANDGERDVFVGSEHEDEYRGAQQYMINDLPTWRFKVKTNHDSEESGEANNNQKSCCICMEDYKNKEKLRTLPCLHFFHTKCIDKWLFKTRTCPICKFDITRNDVSVSGFRG